MKKIIWFLICSMLSAQSDFYEQILTTMDEPYFGLAFGIGMSTNGIDLLVCSADGAHFYIENDSSWINYQNIPKPEQAHDFGLQSILLDNKTFISAIGDGSGKIFIYSKIGSLWEFDSVISIDDDNVSNFGSEFFFSEDIALIKAQRLVDDQEFSEVFVYKFADNSWNYIARIENIGLGFGNSLSIIDSILLTFLT